MLHLLQPVWLFTLTAISVPVIIHLWNQKPGRVLKVGSISLVQETSREIKRSLVISDVLLLILRCLLITALSCAMANPVWQGMPATKKQKGWVLMSREDLRQSYHHFQPVIDSLLKTGMEFHYFNEGFQKKDLQEILTSGPDTTPAEDLSYWNLAADLDQTVGYTKPLYLFTDNLLRHFSGTRPTLSGKLKWQTYMPPDAVRQEEYEQEKGDSTALQITIFDGTNTDDGRYLKAAFEAIREYNKMNIQLFVTGERKAVKNKQDWLFRLSEEPLPNEENNKNVLIYEKGKSKNSMSWIRIADDIAFSPVELYKTVDSGNSENDSMSTLWQDGFGHPILSLEKRKATAYYHFNSRFNPDWNGLVWSNSFPELLLALLKKEEIKTAFREPHDKRIIDARQLLPVFTNENDTIIGQPVAANITDLAELSWMLVFLVLFIERFVAFSYYKHNRNG